MQAAVGLQQRHGEEVLEAHLVVRRLVVLVLVCVSQQIEVLLRGGHQGAAHGVGHHHQTLHADARIVPAAMVVLEGQEPALFVHVGGREGLWEVVPLVVFAVVRGDGALVSVVTRDDLPIDHFAIYLLAIACHNSPPFCFFINFKSCYLNCFM